MRKNNILGPKPFFADEKELLQSLKSDRSLYRKYQNLNSRWKECFQDYCLGKKTLPITYDPFFKRVFHPENHPGRLSRLLSCLIGSDVRVLEILPTEDTLLDGGRLLVMDILVRLADDSLANVEVQKVPYEFPGERLSCYSADLVMRQYARVSDERGKEFRYSDMKKVYTIVIYEKSPDAFHAPGLPFLHAGRILFPSGLKLELLQEFRLLALDVFRKKSYPEDRSELCGWVSFLATDSVEEAQRLAEIYPWLAEIYEEMTEYLQKPEEVLGMFSEALRILDENTVQYMIDEQLQQLDKQSRQLNEQSRQLDEQSHQLNEQSRQLDEQSRQLDEQSRQLEEQSRQLEDQALQLNEQQGLLDQKDAQLARQEALIARLQAELAKK